MAPTTTWACDSSANFALGDYTIEVSWFAQDLSFNEAALKTTIATTAGLVLAGW